MPAMRMSQPPKLQQQQRHTSPWKLKGQRPISGFPPQPQIPCVPTQSMPDSVGHSDWMCVLECSAQCNILDSAAVVITLIIVWLGYLRYIRHTLLVSPAETPQPTLESALRFASKFEQTKVSSAIAQHSPNTTSKHHIQAPHPSTTSKHHFQAPHPSVTSKCPRLSGLCLSVAFNDFQVAVLSLSLSSPSPADSGCF
ncbi:uncharacterized protein BJ171DRAFT_253738 [Polychytrium aggregatum]|uniref:uncharacterized protein n=1 Tax=Polychytrium aggregatum TaxID=110093 RepID=UPI0022FDBFDB|nr:uncharacterized protein BJ171DRAFT_253738 [Polychytrium aggregatum]KAI9193511.1 hypothetical protein BJ171DRAFT_253738 [Polychytrium aggregatum]